MDIVIYAGIVIFAVLVLWVMSGAIVNTFIKIFIHRKNHPDHPPLPTYLGMTVTGYQCGKCGYQWYRKGKWVDHVKKED